MENYTPKIHSVVVQIGVTEKYFSKCFSSKPSPQLEKKFGKIFGFLSIESEDPNIESFVDFIIEQIKDYFYSSAKNVEESRMSQTHEELLEYILQKVNMDIFSHLERKKINFLLKNVHILIAILKDHAVTFSIAGKIHAYLFHFRRGGGYQIVHVHENTEYAAPEMGPLKFFTQTISGRIPDTDTMFFCTHNLLDYLSLESIKNIVTHNEPADAQRQLKIVLSQAGLPKHFLFSIIKMKKKSVSREPEDIKNFNYQEAASKDSVKKLFNTEKATERLLHPSLQATLRKILYAVTSSAKNYFQDFKSGAMALLVLKKSKKSVQVQYHPKRVFPLPLLFSFSRKLIINTWKKVWNATQKKIRHIIQWYISLSRKGKIVMIIAVILALLFVQNISHITFLSTSKRDKYAFEKSYIEIQKMNDSAEASIIYRNENKARDQFQRALDGIALLPEKYHNDQRVIDLKKSITRRLGEFNRMHIIENPIVIGNWSNLDPNAIMSPLLIIKDDILYSQNLNTKEIYSLNSNSHEIKTTLISVKNTGAFDLAGHLENDILFLNTNQTLFVFSPSTIALKPVPITLKNTSKIKSLKSYLGKLYLLDPKNNQIFRSTKSPNGFTSTDEWIRDDIAEIRDARDFAIDGNIYVLKENGAIQKFFNGKVSPFSIKIIDPPLKNPSKIYTSVDSNFLYILDPGERRIIVLDKNGNLAQQYFSPLFDTMKDFAVLENEKRIFVLNGNIVYGFGIQ